MNRLASLSHLLREAAHRLEGIEAGNPPLEAQYLMAQALGCSRVALLSARADDPISEDAIVCFERLLSLRLSGAPLQYVLGTASFCDLELEVGPGVLIPRSETEVLVDLVAREARETGSRLLVDVGTGSGAILLALLRRLPFWRGVGIDRSADALNWAGRNLRHTGLSERGLLVRGDLLQPMGQRSASVVVSNPPYVRTGELCSLPAEIREHEPRLALDGGDDGMGVIRALLDQAPSVLAPGGLFALEVALAQPETVRRLIEATGQFERTAVHPDLTGRPRVVMAWRR
jgi:release factor glutamine methyltransferase